MIALIWPFIFNGPSTNQESCLDYVSHNAKFHSAKPYKDRSDAILIAYRENYGAKMYSSTIQYAGCVIKDSKVDVALTESMFDDDIKKWRVKCMDFRISLAPYDIQGRGKWAAAYGWRQPNEVEVERRRKYCETADAGYFVLKELRWR